MRGKPVSDPVMKVERGGHVSNGHAHANGHANGLAPTESLVTAQSFSDMNDPDETEDQESGDSFEGVYDTFSQQAAAEREEKNGRKTQQGENHPSLLSFDLKFDYEPQNGAASIALGETELIRPGEMLLICASPGTGKSNLMEVIATLVTAAATGIQPVDALGFSLPCATGASRCLIIDGERTRDDAHASLRRIFRRVDKNESIIEDGRIRGLDFRIFVEIATVAERKQELLSLLSLKKYDYLILDGALDFCLDPNDQRLSIEAVRWLRAVAAKFNLSVVTTLHPNPGSTKPVGHLGTFLCRWCRAVLLLQKQPDGTRTITSDFDNGKLSHASEQVTQSFTWDDSLSLFVSAQKPQCQAGKGRKTATSVREIIQEVYAKKITTQLTAIELRRILQKEYAKTDWQVRDTLKTAMDFGYLTKAGTTKAVVYDLAREND